MQEMVDWVDAQLSLSRIRTLIVPFSGGCASVLAGGVCARARGRMELWHMEVDEEGVAQAEKMASDLGHPLLKVFPESPGREDRAEKMFRFAAGRAQENQGVVVSALTRSTGNLARLYQKRGDGDADIFPLLDLFYSEIPALVEGMVSPPCVMRRSEFLGGRPSLDALTGFSLASLEWAERADEDTGLVSGGPSQTSPAWASLTLDQKRMVAKLHERYHRTTHKQILRPAFRSGG